MRLLRKIKGRWKLNEYCIQTGTGYFDYSAPARSTMTREDVAHALHGIRRWGGHTDPYFTVCQHACLVADLVWRDSNDAYAALVALHHDDHETVRGDIPSPRKRFLRDHNALMIQEERDIDRWFYEVLWDIDWPITKEAKAWTKYADAVALVTEKKYLKPDTVIWANVPDVPVEPEDVFNLYMKNADWKNTYLNMDRDFRKMLADQRRIESE